jgi:hypothetical protein
MRNFSAKDSNLQKQLFNKNFKPKELFLLSIDERVSLGGSDTVRIYPTPCKS